MLRVTLGLALDGERAWTCANRLGAPTLGPLGFLGLLEAQLGLGREWPSQAERVVQYRDCLKHCDSPGRFYHRTFEIDELGAAATLLKWRDLWYLHGWDGSIAASAPRRLRDMGEVEAWAGSVMSASVGERLQAVIDVLSRRRLPIDEIVLVDPIGSFPSRWQQVIRLFRFNEAAQFSTAVGTGFLDDLQRAVLAVQRPEPVSPIEWHDDATVSVVRADSLLLSARWLAEQIKKDSENTLLVAGADGALLDETFAAADVSRRGFRNANEFRPSLQLLPLSMSLLWEPLDFYALLAFLSHPISPLPRFARWRLAEKLARSPGVGGELWEAALKTIAEHYGDQAAKVGATIDRWLCHERFSEKAGAPVQSLLARARAVADFFRERMGERDEALLNAYSMGLAHVTAFVNVLERLVKQGVVTRSRAQVDQLLAQVTSTGRANSLLEAEVGCLLTTTDPGAVIEHCDRVIWWQLAAPASIPRYPWSQREIADLSRSGVALPSVKELLAQVAETWSRPVRAARKQLTLVLPPEGVEVHPIWLMLDSLVRGLPVRPVECALLAEDAPGVAAIAHRALPARRRWWQLGPDVTISKPDSSSFTSLNLLLNGPHEWVLKYAAKLRNSDIMALSDGPLLFGNLAHRLIERAYGSASRWKMDERSFEQWLDCALPGILSEEGAVLLMPGRKADLERFRSRMRDGLRELRVQFSRATVVDAVPEMKLSGSYAGGSLTGSADLVLGNGQGRRAILDVKWGGRGWYRKLLEQNRHLQLTVYAELLRQQTGAWPDVAYFILAAGRVVARTGGFFPGPQDLRGDSTEITANVWQRFLVSWRWRMDQLAAGRIEVVREGIDATPESNPADGALAIEDLNPSYSDFPNLAGWGPQS